MFNHYVINVSLHGEHFFATAPQSITDKSKLLTVYNVLRSKFPTQAGYKCDVVYWDCSGTIVRAQDIFQGAAVCAGAEADK